MPTPVEMPQLGNTVEECVLTRWLKQPGDTVSPGDMLAEIETDKTTFEVTAPVGGTLLATFFDDGVVVPVFTFICVIGDPGDAVDAFRPGATTGASDAASRTAAAAAAPAVGTEREADAIVATTASLSPRASRVAAELGLSSSQTAAIRGSGPGGRVLERDVRAAAGATTRQPSSAGSPVSTHAAPSGLRGTIARRMRESLSSMAQYTLQGSADATGLLAVRSRIKSRAQDGLPDITINELVAFCTIQALRDAPHVNAEFIDGRLVAHTDVNLGFAVDTPRGLLAPVVHGAHDLSLQELALRMKQLSNQAVNGTIPADALTGGTFTITNLGNLGIEAFTPLINPPQVAILGVDGIQLRPVRRSGRVEFVDTLGLSLTCDHQVIDGAPGARFLQILRHKIEGIEGLAGY